MKAPEVNASIRLLKDMPSEARRAIVSWEYSGWQDGPLEKAYRDKNSVWKDIEKHAEKLRDIIRKRHGNTVRLYRGIVNEKNDGSKYTNRQLSSWTARKEVAAIFAGLAVGNGAKNIKLNKNIETANEFLLSITDKEANRIQDKVMKDGKAIYKTLLFKTNSSYPDYVDIYKKGKRGYSFYADEEKTRIAELLIRRREEERKFKNKVNTSNEREGYVVVADIPVEDIVWVLNNGKTYSGTIEYIVRGNAGMKSKKVDI